MKVNKISHYSGFKISKIEDYIKSVDTDLTNLDLFTHSRVRFGDGTDGAMGENIAGQFQVFTSSATVLTDNTISHTLANTPVCYLVVKQDKSASLYAGVTTWNTTNIYLVSSETSVTYTLFLLK